MEFGGWLTFLHAGLRMLMPPGRAGSGPWGAHLEAKLIGSLEMFKIVRCEGWVGNARSITQAIHFSVIPCWFSLSFISV